MTKQTDRSARLASLEDELRTTCQQFLELQSRLTTQPAQNNSGTDDRILKAMLAALSQILNAFGDHTAHSPDHLSLLAAYVFLPGDASTIAALDEASELLRKVGEIIQALITERRSESKRGRSMPPEHKRSGTRRISQRELTAMQQKLSTLPPPALETFLERVKQRVRS